MQSSHFKPLHLFSLLLALAMALTLLPMFSVSAMGAEPDPNVLDLSSPPNSGATGTDGRFTVDAAAYTITVSGADPITITGDGTNAPNGWSVIVSDATQINLAAGTVIQSTADKDALEARAAGEVTVSGPSSGTPPTITGTGTGSSDSISVSNGSLKIAGHFGAISSTGGSGIFATGDVLIDASAEVAGISGAVSAINSGGTVTISGAVGPMNGEYGIYNPYGNDVIISAGANVVSVSGGVTGFFTNRDVIISGTVGPITGTSDLGINTLGVVTISGKVGAITGGAKPISATSYAVLDYTGLALTDSDPAVSHTVTFNYGTLTPGGDMLQNAHLGGATLIPAPTAPGYEVQAWYKTPDFTGSPWDFATDTVDGIASTLYAGATTPVTPPSPDGGGGGCNAAGFAPVLLALAAVAIWKKR